MKTIRTKKKGLFMRLCVFAFAAYMIVSLVTLQMEISAKRGSLSLVQEQIDAQRTANKDIQRLIGYSDDQDYLGRIARDKLDMGYPDERVYRDAAGS